MRRLTLFLVLICLLGFLAQAQKTRTISTSFYFETDKYQLAAAEQQKLESLIETLIAATDYDIAIEAFTDEQGSDTYNQQLASRRAKSIMSAFKSKKITAKSLSIKALGEIVGIDDEARRQNRRVDVVATITSVETVADLQQMLQRKNTEQFEFMQERDTTFVGKQLIAIKIPKGSLVFEDGTVPTGAINLQVIEATRPSDWIANNLSTVSNGKLLASGGMLSINATSEGKPLKIKAGQSLDVTVPTKNLDPEMELFDGQHQEDGVVTWAKNLRKTVGKKQSPKLTYFTLIKNRVGSIPFFVPFDVSRPNETMPNITSFAQKGSNYPILEEYIPLEKPEMDFPLPKKPNTLKAKEVKIWYNKNKENELQEANDEKIALKNAQRQIRYQEDMLTYAKEKACYDSALVFYEKQTVSNKRILVQNEQKIRAYAKNLAKHDIHSRIYFELQNSALLENENLSWADHGKFHTAADLIRQQESQKLVYTLCKKKYGMDRKDVRLEDYTALVLTEILNDKSKVAYLKNEINKKFEENLKGKTALDNISAYSFSVSEFNWINIDKFMNIPEAQRMALNVTGDKDTRVFVLFKDSNSLIPMKQVNDGFHQSDMLPKGSDITLVAMKIAGGKAQLSTMPFKVPDTKQTIELPPFQAYNVADLQVALEKLNGE